MNLTRLIFLICIFLSSVMGAEAAPESNAPTKRREKPRPPSLFTSTKPLTPPQALVPNTTTTEGETKEAPSSVREEQQSSCTWKEHSPEIQQEWIQSELRRLVDEKTTYEILKEWVNNIWHYANVTSRFLIVDYTYNAWKLHIADKKNQAPEWMKKAPKWMAEFFGPFSNDITQPVEYRIRANEILGEIARFSKRIAMQAPEMPKTTATDTSAVPAKTERKRAPQPIAVPKPRSATADIYPYTAATVTEVVCKMEQLSKESKAADKKAIDTLLNIAENQAMEIDARALAYIVLGNGKYGDDSGIKCYQLAPSPFPQW